MQICIQRARNIGAATLVCRAMPEMDSAIKLCEQMGFQKRTEAGTLHGAMARLIDYVYRTRQGQGLHPSPEEVHAFMARFAESNEAVRAKYFPERKTLFDIKAKPAVSAELTKDDIFGIFSGFIVEERARVRDRRGGSDDDEDDDDYDRDAED